MIRRLPAPMIALSVGLWSVAFVLAVLPHARCWGCLGSFAKESGPLHLAFIAAFAGATLRPRVRWHWFWALVACQTLSELGLMWTSPAASIPLLGIVVLWQVAMASGTRAAAAWCVAHSAALLAVVAAHASRAHAIEWGLLFVAYQAAGFGAAILASREAARRRQLARANAELRLTRRLLEEQAELRERARIARDLHDAVGHQLTALSLQLEVAARADGGAAGAAVGKARGIASNLLAEVREVVSNLRREERIDVRAALVTLASDVEGLEVVLDVPDELPALPREESVAVLRCVQEAITNALRHASARRLSLVIRAEGGRLTVEAVDDGRGCRDVTPGNGLAGMRERLEALGGRLTVNTRPGAGFRLFAQVLAPSQ